MTLDLGTAIQQYGYPVVFIGSLLEGETVLALGGLAAHRGYLALHWVVACAAAGGFLGDQLYFALGRLYGERLVERYPRLAPAVGRARALLEGYDAWVVIGVRFMYGLRTAGPFAMGMTRIEWLRFAWLNLVGAVLWAPLFAAAGYLFGEALQRLLGDLKRVEHWLFGALVIAGVAFWLARRRRWRSRPPGA
jgi:membrane protein DedA with SNARE-associated domain